VNGSNSITNAQYAGLNYLQMTQSMKEEDNPNKIKVHDSKVHSESTNLRPLYQ
jgi:hypothetical protein